jgi:simple sugar transport system permease protein
MFPGFFSLRVFVNFFLDNAFLGIAAVGMTFVILTGGIDLSVGAVIALSGVLLAKLVETAGLSPIVAILVVLGLGLALGTMQGSIIHFFNAPPFIVTLGGMFFARGLAQTISLESVPIYNPFFERFTLEGIPLPGGVLFPWLAVLFLAVFSVGLFVAHRTPFGRNVYAVGGSESSSKLMGLPVAATKVGTYALSGFLFALSGIAFTMYTSAGYSLAGSGFEMEVIASVVIGGTLITGGSGYLAGTLLGVLIQAIIQTFISFQGTLNSWWTRIAIGFLLFVFILFQRIFVRFGQK